MSSKSRPKPAAKAKPAAKTSTIAKVANVAKAGATMLGIGGGSKKTSSRRSKKKSALWYARAIQREKLKRKYEKLKFGYGR